MNDVLRHLALVLAACAAAAADPLAPGSEGSLEIPGYQHPCVLYIPSDYVAGTPTPLIMFMHGSGGKPTTWPFRDATAGKGHLIVGLSYGGLPGAGAQGIKGDPASCTAMIAFIAKVRERIAATYSVDQQRVVLGGLSMGGWGVNMYGFKPEAKGRFCGYAIIAAGAEPTQGDLTVARGLPVLVLNGQNDPNLATANQGMPALEQAGVNATQVILPGEGHVPGNAAMGPPIANWLADIAAAAARSRALVAVSWTRAELAGPQGKGGDPKAALAGLLAGQPWLAATDATKPVLIFIRSGLQAPDGTPAAQTRDSAAVEEAVSPIPRPAGCPPPAGMRPASTSMWRSWMRTVDMHLDLPQPIPPLAVAGDASTKHGNRPPRRTGMIFRTQQAGLVGRLAAFGRSAGTVRTICASTSVKSSGTMAILNGSPKADQNRRIHSTSVRAASPPCNPCSN